MSKKNWKFLGVGNEWFDAYKVNYCVVNLHNRAFIYSAFTLRHKVTGRTTNARSGTKYTNLHYQKPGNQFGISI